MRVAMPPLPQYVMALCLIKNRENFTFTSPKKRNKHLLLYEQHTAYRTRTTCKGIWKNKKHETVSIAVLKHACACVRACGAQQSTINI